MLGEVEDAIIAALQRLPLKVASHAATEVDDVLEFLLGHAPACAVVFSGGEWRRESGIVYRRVARFQVIVVAQSLRSERASRHGAGPDIGAYALVESIEACLVGSRLGREDIEALEPLRTENLYAGQYGASGLAIYGLEFSTAWQVTRADEEAGELRELLGQQGLVASEYGQTDLITWSDG